MTLLSLPPAPRIASAQGFAPAARDFGPAALAGVGSLVEAGVREGAYPGAALVVGRRSGPVLIRGYGRVDWAPGSPAATPGTLWDLASLTKVVGTTTAVMVLVDRGEIRLSDPVVRHLPEWGGGDPRKARVTVEDLLLHRAGLPPYLPLYRTLEGRDAYWEAYCALPLDREPGVETVYSDIGFQILGFLVERVSASPLDAFLREEVFLPLGMAETRFNPPAALWPRVAPTEVDTTWRGRGVEGGVHLQGQVHDENAWAQGGVAGHAGLFSTATDLAAFAQAMLAALEGPAPAFPATPGTVDRFTRRHDDASTRALGWDTPAPTSSSGALLSPRAFGHTGFTGTSIWIDPELDLYVILLTNRVNPTRENRKLFPIRRAVAEGAVRALAGPGEPGTP